MRTMNRERIETINIVFAAILRAVTRNALRLRDFSVARNAKPDADIPTSDVNTTRVVPSPS